MKQTTLPDILAAFPTKTVLIVGDVMLDEYIWGEVRRISPEAPVPVVEIHRRAYGPGGAANTAANVVSLAGRAVLCGIIGSDHHAEKLEEALHQAGVDTAELVVDDGRPTTTKTRIVARSQQLVRLDAEQTGPLRIELEDALLQCLEKRLIEADVCILSDYGKGVVSSRIAECFIRQARDAAKPLIVDPQGSNYVKYRGATLITPNVQEAERALNREINGDIDLVEVGQRLLNILSGSSVLITRGAQGMSLFVNGAEPIHIPTLARNVFDVSGAGDTVVSTIALALAAGASLKQALTLSNRAAGIVVGKFGTATVTLKELMTAECL